MSFNGFAESLQKAEQFEQYVSSSASSPGRLFSEVHTPMLTVKSAQGATIRDIDDNEYIDFVMGLGPNILGHGPQPVRDAICDQLGKGMVLGMNSALELDLAKRIVDACSHVEQVRFTCSGTEAVMTALRIARAHTNRPGILKFRGGYHGHSDCTLSSNDKRNARTKPGSIRNGIHEAISGATLVSAYNDTAMAEAVIRENADRLAAVILEPVASNMGLILPDIGFLERLRSLCTEHGIVLIFDEVVSGFRFCFGPVSSLLGIEPDMTTFGKIIGGGLAVGAYGGRADLMREVSQNGGVFQGGTFAGNPLTMAAGLATLRELSAPGFYQRIEQHARSFKDIAETGFAERGIPYTVQQFGPLASFIMSEDVTRLSSLDDVAKQDAKLFSRFHLAMARKGVLFAPTIEEPIFFSAAHSPDQVAYAAKASVEVLAELRRAGGD